MNRTAIINLLIKEFGYHSYLEIGVQNPANNFDRIMCDNKIGVDPCPLRDDIIKLTSDDYFTGLQPNVKFDIIFIDGLHHSVQVLRDVKNSLVHLNTGGTIVCHDMLPENEDMQKVPMPDSQKHAWTGDCWKAWAYLRMVEPNLDMLVLNADFGVGIIQVGTQEIFEPFVKMENLEYDFLQSHKHKLLNVKNLKEVIEFS
jgi:hypothetical protein